MTQAHLIMLACGFRAAHSSNQLDRDSGGERVRMPLQLKAALAAELRGGLVFAQTSAEHPLLLRSLQALYKRADQADILEESYM